ncbi:hypothetical protein TWF281_000448 [Arthrobotrys megalospora]
MPKRKQPVADAPDAPSTSTRTTRKRTAAPLPEQELPSRRSQRSRTTVAATEATSSAVAEQSTTAVGRTRRGKAAAPQQPEPVVEDAPPPTTRTRATRSKAAKVENEPAKEEDEAIEQPQESSTAKPKKEPRKKKTSVAPSTRTTRSRSNSVVSVDLDELPDAPAQVPAAEQEPQDEDAVEPTPAQPSTRKIAKARGKRKAKNADTQETEPTVDATVETASTEYSGPRSRTRSKGKQAEGKENEKQATDAPKRATRSKRAQEPADGTPVDQPTAKRQKVQNKQETAKGPKTRRGRSAKIARDASAEPGPSEIATAATTITTDAAVTTVTAAPTAPTVVVPQTVQTAPTVVVPPTVQTAQAAPAATTGTAVNTLPGQQQQFNEPSLQLFQEQGLYAEDEDGDVIQNTVDTQQAMEAEEDAPTEPNVFEEATPAEPEAIEEDIPVEPEVTEENAPAEPEIMEEDTPAEPEVMEEDTPAEVAVSEEGTPAEAEAIEDVTPAEPEAIGQDTPAEAEPIEEDAPTDPEVIREDAPAESGVTEEAVSQVDTTAQELVTTTREDAFETAHEASVTIEEAATTTRETSPIVGEAVDAPQETIPPIEKAISTNQNLEAAADEEEVGHTTQESDIVAEEFIAQATEPTEEEKAVTTDELESAVQQQVKPTEVEEVVAAEDQEEEEVETDVEEDIAMDAQGTSFTVEEISVTTAAVESVVTHTEQESEAFVTEDIAMDLGVEDADGDSDSYPGSGLSGVFDDVSLHDAETSEQGVLDARVEESPTVAAESELNDAEGEASMHFAQASEQGVQVARVSDADLTLDENELAGLYGDLAARQRAVHLVHQDGDEDLSLCGSEVEALNAHLSVQLGYTVTAQKYKQGGEDEGAGGRGGGSGAEDVDMMDVDSEFLVEEERGDTPEKGDAADGAWSGPANPSALAPLSQAAINAGHTAQDGASPEEAGPGADAIVPQTPTRPTWGQWGHLRHQPRLSSPLKSYCITAQYSPPTEDTPARGRRVSENEVSTSGDPSPLRSEELLVRDFSTPVGSPSPSSPRMRPTPGPRRRSRSRSVCGSSPLKNAVDFAAPDAGDEAEGGSRPSSRMASPLARLASDYDPNQDISELREEEVPMTPNAEQPLGNVLDEVVEEQLPVEGTAGSPKEKPKRRSRLPVPKPAEKTPGSPLSARSKRVSQTKNLSDRELSKVTARNTTRNGVYKNAKFERQVVRITRQRPPSPTRDTQTAAAEEARQLRQRVFEERGVALGPGDDSDYVPPQVSPSAKKVKWHELLEHELDEDEKASFYTEKGILAPERVRRDSGTVHEITIQKILYEGEKDVLDEDFEEGF